jgi:hypothetical protein
MPIKSRGLKPRQLELIVVLDTNALYTGSASYLLRQEVVSLITRRAEFHGLARG